VTIYEELRRKVTAAEPVALLTVIDGPHLGAKLLVGPPGPLEGSLGDADLDRVAVRDAVGELEAGRNVVRHYGEKGQAGETTVHVFIECYAAPPRMLVFGAVDFTASLVKAAKLLGYHVTVCDAREVFATRRRFPEADEVVVDWPHRLIEHVQEDEPLTARDAICVLTHDHKFDVPAIVAALRTDVGYIGAMGSRRTDTERRDRLRSEGVGEDELARIMAPIGLDLGARTPEETAVAICAEIIALRTGREAPSLRDRTGSIH
jgi:xanthine dehydrogenase accessory factor